MIHIIYMAAGNSRRFGSNKLFYELDGKPMYRHLLERLVEIKDRYNKLKKAGKKIKNAESNNPVICKIEMESMSGGVTVNQK